MSLYAENSPASIEAATAAPSGPAGGGRRGRSGRLVSSSISQTLRLNPSETGKLVGVEIYPRALRIVRESHVEKKGSPPVRGEIDNFSDKSRSRLRFVAGNTCIPLVSQFCMTYHNSNPDGRTVKRHLNAFLTKFRKHYPSVHYLWILEFQTRGVPHFHLYTSLPHTTNGLHEFLAKSWHRIAEPSSPEHLRFHLHPRNFTAWDMTSPGYLTKYLEKQNQKHVPEGFTGCGRFWGHSRDLVAIPEISTLDDVKALDWFDQATGEYQDAERYIIRTLSRWHSSKLRKYGKKSRVGRTQFSYLLQEGAAVFRQCVSYLVNNAPEVYPF